MESEIWRVRTERIGTLESFKSEYDMESFLMNNPAIIGCWNPDAGLTFPTLIRQQLYTKKGAGGGGRIDLVGISISDKGYELRIFELKASKIDVPAVEQLHNYLNGWRNEGSARHDIERWILELELDGIDSSNVDKIVNCPRGVLVGPEFDIDAIVEAKKIELQGIRLSRFKTESGSEYYVIIEDQVGDVVQHAKRQQIGWDSFIDKGLIEQSDIFGISIPKEGIELCAKPDPGSFGTASKKFIFEKDSASKILGKEGDIRNNANEYEKKWIDKVIQSIKNEKGILITHATGIVYLAFGWPKSYWVPGQYWVHKKTNKSLDELKVNLIDKNVA